MNQKRKVLLFFTLAFSFALATIPDSTVFELDGNAFSDGNPDWSTLYPNGAGNFDFTFQDGQGTQTFTGGGSKVF